MEEQQFKKPSFYKSINSSSYIAKELPKKNDDTFVTQILKQYLPYVYSKF